MSRRITIVTLLLSLGAMTLPTRAALNAYLHLKVNGSDIDGGSSYGGEEGSIEIPGFSQTIVAVRDAASGLPTGKRQHKPITITKEIDKSTPLLQQALSRNEVVDGVIHFYRPMQTGGQEQYYTVEFTNGRIAGIRQEMLNNKYPENFNLPMMEKVTFVYQNITWTWEDGGIESQAAWDVAGGGLPPADLNFDNVVNLVDYVLMAQEFLMEGSDF